MKPTKSRTCEICNKSFKKHSNLVLHQNKKKSCSPDTKKFKCEYCNALYGSISGLKYHVDQCEKNDNNDAKQKSKQLATQYIKLEKENKIIIKHTDNNEIKHLNNQYLKDEKILKLEKENAKVKKENEKLNNDQRDYYKKIIDTNIANGNMQLDTTNNAIQQQAIQPSFLSTKYIKDNFVNGKLLMPIHNYDIILVNNITELEYATKNDMLNNIKIVFVEKLFMYCDIGYFTKYICDIITSQYKMDNPGSQSLWTTDVSRLTFLIRIKLFGTTLVDWLKDCSGEHIKIIIIKPLLNYICDCVTLYKTLQCDKMNQDKILNIKNLLNALTGKSISTEIIKLMAIKFSFDGMVIPK